jgi:hypothetical protein
MISAPIRKSELDSSEASLNILGAAQHAENMNERRSIDKFLFGSFISILQEVNIDQVLQILNQSETMDFV